MMASTSKPFAIYFFVEEAMGKIKIFRKDSRNIRAEKTGTCVAQLARAAARNGSAYNCTHKRRRGASLTPSAAGRRFESAPQVLQNSNLNIMKRLIRRYIRKRVWESRRHIIGPQPSDYDDVVEWVMQGYPFRWRTRLWAANSATHCRYQDIYKWLID